MNEIELLLTEEFATFSKTVASVYEEKKHLEEEFKKYFEEYKNKKAVLEKKVADANAKLDEWKKSLVSKK